MPVLVVWVAVCQETGDRFRYFLVGEDVPQTVSSQHQNVVTSMLALRQRVHFDLKVKGGGEQARVERWIVSWNYLHLSREFPMTSVKMSHKRLKLHSHIVSRMRGAGKNTSYSDLGKMKR